MKKHPLCTIVNFCSNESRFLKATLEQALYFSRQVIVCVCDHFFDGTPENRRLLEQIYSAFPHCLFVEYPFIPQKIPKKMWKKVNPAHFWHSLSRLIGYFHLDEEIETILFLDADEVPEGKRFAEWLDCSDYQLHTTLKLSNFWYFREPCNQALKIEDSIVLVQRRALESDVLLHQEEREAIYHLLPGPKRRNVTGPDGNPMFHHYSWVRTQEEMLKKVRSLGKTPEQDWEALVNQEFAAPFKGTDFIHGYSYKVVKPFFDICFDPLVFEPKGAPKVKKLTQEETLKIAKIKKGWNFLDF